MKFVLASSPHQRQPRTSAQIMRLVAYATLPGLVIQCWFFGFGVLIQAILAIAVAMLSEAVMLAARKRPIWPTLQDTSAALTGLLLALCLPPLLPWWMTVTGVLFAIIIVKQLYGGLGNNLFNPAMAAYVMLLISFPQQMTAWLAPDELLQQHYGLFDACYLIFSGFSEQGYSLQQIRTGIDGTTMATPLDGIKTALNQGLTLSESLASLPDAISNAWLWVNLAFLVGGLWLIQQKIITWHIPVAMLSALFVCASVGWLLDADQLPSPLFHLFSGGAMLGAFFIATDPVSAATSNKGKMYFAAGIGILVYLIRSFGGYPDAIAFAVLLMNMAVPLLDLYTRPTVYGRKDAKHD